MAAPTTTTTSNRLSMHEFARRVLQMGVPAIQREFQREIRRYAPPNPDYHTGDAHPECNRYTDVKCLDNSRVRLYMTTRTPMPHDYINANWVRLLSSNRQLFIATQAPLLATQAHFWRMAFQEKTPSIIMLCQCQERGQTHDYWPTQVGTAEDHDGIKVKNLGNTQEDRFDVTTLEVSYMNGKPLGVKLYRTTEWPDRSTPRNPFGILRLLRTVRERSSGPAVVHCSAGLGRTGTIIAIEDGVQSFRKERLVNVPQIVKNIRNQRLGAVQTERQYVFIYTCLLYYIFSAMQGEYDEPIRRFHQDFLRV